MSYVSAEEALQAVQSGQRLFIHGSASTPIYMLHALAQQKDRLQDIEMVSVSMYGDVELDKPEYYPNFKFNSLFVSASVRNAVKEGRADYVPVFLSEIPELFKRGILPIDVAIVQVSPPDVHGYCSLGPSVDVARSAVDTAKKVIAQVNPKVPRTHGDGMIHISQLHSMTWKETPLQEGKFAEKVGKEELEIGKIIAGLIEDRSTLQMGIGSIPDAVLRALGNHKDLGIHTEMFSDGIIDLVEKGVVNNR